MTNANSTPTSKTKLNNQIEASKSKYDALKNQYETATAEYQKKLADYTNQVAYWNARGGAPKDEFDKLEAERQQLNKLAVQINSLANQLNTLATQLNIKVDQYNASAGVIFDQGQYTGGEITVYQFDNYNDLVLIIAHELGHALHLDHVDDPKAVMYYLKKDQNPRQIALTDADIKALKNECQKPYLLEPLTWKELAIRLRGRLVGF